MDLLLMRHAKSDWGQGLKDFDRPLNERGKKAAEKDAPETNIASRKKKAPTEKDAA